jgi:hypothetical protein
VRRGTKTVICVAGWHYNRQLYEDLRRVDADVYVVSHRSRLDTPDLRIHGISEKRVRVAPNLGYDWGCYQQFLASRAWIGYDLVVFMHDDVRVLDPAFPEACVELLAVHAVVGNGRISDEPRARNAPDRVPWAYAFSCWKPESREFEHGGVRGSFFATTPQALRALGAFEVFWDVFHVSEGFGNWSLCASCGRWESALGPGCFGFLSETYCQSPFLLEEVRGSAPDRSSELTVQHRWALSWIHGLSDRYMHEYWRCADRFERTVRLLPLAIPLSVASGSQGALCAGSGGRAGQ